MNGADIIAQTLRRCGVTFLSTIVGNGINPVLHAARQAGIRVVDTRNEQTASYMAEVYGRLTGRVGVCAVSASVGHTNALTGLLSARLDGAPMLLISGSADHGYTDMGKFQDFDQVATAVPIAKYARFVDRPDKIAFYLREALAHAVAGRPGPVHLTIPQDVLQAEVGDTTLPSSDAGTVRPQGQAGAGLIDEAANAIAASKRPVLVAGSGVYYAHGEDALARFAALAQLPVVIPIWDRGSVPAPIPQFLGVVGAVSGSPELLEESDLIILAGARVDYRLGYLRPPAVRPDARVLRIDVDPLELRQGIEPDLALQGDPRSVLDQLGRRLEGVSMDAHAGWLEEARRRERSFRRCWQPEVYRSVRPTGWHVVEALRPLLQGDAIFMIDGGNIGQWMHMLLSDRYPGFWMTCGASGVVGYGLGASMAARLAYPDRPVILLTGDGSMGFNLADLEAASRHRLPFVVVVADDRSWGITLSNQLVQYGPENSVGCTLSPVRYDQVAQALGAHGSLLEDPKELAPAVERALASDRPTVIQVPIAPGGPAD